MFRTTLRFLLVLAALSLLPVLQAVPAGILPNHPPPTTAGAATSHGTAMEPASLLGRHYNVSSKRQLVYGPMVDALGLPSMPGANTTPRRPTTQPQTAKKTATDNRPKPQPVPRGVIPGVDSDSLFHVPGIPLRKREVGDTNLVSNVEPAHMPSTPVPAPPVPTPPSPPPEYQPQYSKFATPTSATEPPAPKDPKKGQNKSKGKDKTKEDKKKS